MRGPADPLGICLRAACALPEAYDVSFRVLEVGCEAHVSNWLFLPDHLAAQLLNVLQRRLNVRNVYRDNRVLDLVVALCHSAVDGSGLGGHPGLLVNLCCPNHVVLHSGGKAVFASDSISSSHV